MDQVRQSVLLALVALTLVFSAPRSFSEIPLLLKNLPSKKEIIDFSEYLQYVL